MPHEVRLSSKENNEGSRSGSRDCGPTGRRCSLLRHVSWQKKANVSEKMQDFRPSRSFSHVGESVLLWYNRG
jgi:hypothetical protein